MNTDITYIPVCLVSSYCEAVPPRPGVPPEATRRGLLVAAAEVFAERGFAAASLEEIASRAGLTRGAFHWHFKSKKELFIAVMQERAARAIADRDDVAAQTGSFAGFNVAQRQTSARRPTDQQRRAVVLALEFFLLGARDEEIAAAAREIKRVARAATAAQLESLAAATGHQLPLPALTLASGLLALDDGFALQGVLDPTIKPDLLWDLLDLLASAVFGPSASPAERATDQPQRRPR
jgi:AcrR family transcriptional regulator